MQPTVDYPHWGLQHIRLQAEFSSNVTVIPYLARTIGLLLEQVHTVFHACVDAYAASTPLQKLPTTFLDAVATALQASPGTPPGPQVGLAPCTLAPSPSSPLPSVATSRVQWCAVFTCRWQFTLASGEHRMYTHQLFFANPGPLEGRFQACVVQWNGKGTGG